MNPRIRYAETPDEYKVRYVECELFEGTKCFEMLDNDPSIAKARVAELRQHTSNGTYTSLIVKWGFCWAEYWDGGGWKVHTPLMQSDFVSDTPEMFMPSLQDDYTAAIMVPTHGLHTKHKRDGVESFSVRFGPRVPKDYYGDYDYSTYPGGYSPHAAVTGDWEGDY